MDIEDFKKMSEEEVLEFQEKNRRKLASTRARIKEQKAQAHRWIVRGKMVEDLVPGAKELSDDALLERLCELIYK